jgi:diguanylate cyclase (GGDEF)-like protein
MSERGFLEIGMSTEDARSRGRELGRLAVKTAGEGAGAAFELGVYAAQLEARILELQLQVGLDHLTGTKSRRALEATLEVELSRTRRAQTPTAILMVDVDHFKKINDEHGHGAGDAVLRAVGEALLEARRPTDSVGRVGGEEFALVLSNADELQALACAERARKAIEDLEVSGLSVTASIGVHVARGREEDVRSTFAAADEALYRAKRGGRNRVAVSC